MGDGDPGQPLIFLFPVLLVFALQDAPCDRSTQGLVGFIHAGQQFHIAGAIAPGEAMPLVDGDLHFPALLIALDQAGHLRSAQPRHLLQVPSQQAAHSSPLLPVLLMHQHLLHPLVNLLSGFSLEPDSCAGLQKRLDLIQI